MNYKLNKYLAKYENMNPHVGFIPSSPLLKPRQALSPFDTSQKNI